MKRLALAVALSVFSAASLAANPACDAKAAEKNLAGAAKTSFLKKCEKDALDAATKACEAKATDKSLNGAARTSFTKKCVTDATTGTK